MDSFLLDEQLRNFLREDLEHGDITTDASGNPVVVYLDTWNSTLNLAIAGSRTPLNHSETGVGQNPASDLVHGANVIHVALI